MPDPHASWTGVLLQLGIVVFLVLLNGFFVASEFGLVAVRRTRMNQLAEAGNLTARLVHHVTGDLDRYIAATQVGITIASLLLGGYGEHALEPIFNQLLYRAFIPAEFLGVTRALVAFILSYFLMTTMHVVIGELIPKSIALQKNEATALLIVRPMVFFAQIFAPLVWLLNGLGGLILKLFGMHQVEDGEQVHSPEELDLLFTQSFERGELSGTERELLHRVVRFSDSCAREVMVPRVELTALPVQITLEALQKYLYNEPHNRVPVYQDSLDEVLGIVHLNELVRLEAKLREEKVTSAVSLEQYIKPVLRVPESLTIDKLLNRFKHRRQQLAIVIDEFGGTSGIITMGDFLTEVFGDVPDEYDHDDPEIIEQENNTLTIQGRVRIETINDKYGTNFSDEVADTIAGLVLDTLGRPARVGDTVDVDDTHFEIIEVDRLRITKLKVLLAKRQHFEDSESESG